MRITIVGHGRIGGGLAKAWARHGHALTFAARHPDQPDLVALAAALGAAVRPIPEGLATAEVIVLALPAGAVTEVIDSYDGWAGKIVIDCTNAVAPGFQPKYLGDTSQAEEIAKRIPGAKVVKSFNAQGAENLAAPAYDGVAASNFYCGDDADAKAVVHQLVTDAGFEPVDAGSLRQARLLESLMFLWIGLSQTQGSRDIAFKLLRR